MGRRGRRNKNIWMHGPNLSLMVLNRANGYLCYKLVERKSLWPFLTVGSGRQTFAFDTNSKSFFCASALTVEKCTPQRRKPLCWSLLIMVTQPKGGMEFFNWSSDFTHST
jgi:hypothetical protein